jgi:5-bromo-4-chloroindolyl phosphate hydrolysis protein
MAQRYGGRYSPDAKPGEAPAIQQAPRFRDRPAQQVSTSARFMFFAPLPLLFSGIGEIMQGDILGMIVELGTFGIFMLGAWLLNEGLRAEQAFASRKIAKPPVIPRKLFSAVLTGIGVASAVWLAAGNGMFAGIAAGIFTTIVQLFVYGFDPMRSKGVEGISAFDSERVAKAVDKAEARLKEITVAAEQIGDRALQGRVERLCDSARAVMREVESDPRDLTRARKFLSIYLIGLRDATVKFAALYRKNRSQSARNEYEALLGDLEKSFAQHREELLLDDRSALDVEIEVLRERLKQEGLGV